MPTVKHMRITNIGAAPTMQDKLVAVILMVIMVLSLLLSTTYALSESLQGLNKFGSSDNGKSVVLHNDYEGGTDKRIYVENSSEDTELYVRIRLQEYMDLESWSDRELSDEHWQTHIPGVSPQKDNPLNSKLAEYHDRFAWGMGGEAWYLPNSGFSGVENNLNVNSGTPNAAKTFSAEVITMSEYLTKTNTQKMLYMGWVYDSDGWAYWSLPLVPNTATGLLINSVTPDSLAEKLGYYYAIKVTMEAVDKDDLGMWITPSGNEDGLGLPSVLDLTTQSELATSDAIDMLNLISTTNPGVAGLEIVTAPTEIYYLPGDIFDPTGLSIKATYINGKVENLSSGFTSPTNTMPNNTTHATISYGGATAEVPIVIHPVQGLKNKAPNTKTTIDGIGWQVVGKKTVGGKNYALLITANTMPAIPHTSLTTSMTTYYINTIKYCPTLMDALVVPSFHNSSYYSGSYLVTSRTSSPTIVLAKDLPLQTTDIAFALDHIEHYDHYNAFQKGNGTKWWMYAYHTFDQAVGILENGTQADLLYSTPGIGYRPAVWVMLP